MQLHYTDCIKWINICDRSSMSIDNDISEIRKYKEQCDHITAYMKEVLCTRLESILGANVYSDHDFTSNINFPKVTTLYIVNNDRFNGNIKDVITTRLPCLMSTDQLFKKKRVTVAFNGSSWTAILRTTHIQPTQFPVSNGWRISATLGTEDMIGKRPLIAIATTNNLLDVVVYSTFPKHKFLHLIDLEPRDVRHFRIFCCDFLYWFFRSAVIALIYNCSTIQKSIVSN